MKSIRLRLLVLVLAVLIPAVLAAAWVIGTAYKNERALLQGRLRDTTRALSLVVDRDISRRADLVRVLADAQFLDRGADLSARDMERFVLQARRALAPMAGWIEINGPDGLLLTTRAWPAGVQPAAGARRSLPLLDAPLVRALYDDGDGVGPRAAVVQPVRRDGRTLLNLTLTILPQELQSLIDGQTLPAEAVATILDDRGVVVARHPGGADYVGRTASPDMLARFRIENEALFESVSLDGMPTFGYFATAPQGWIYLTAWPQETYTRAIPAAVLPLVLSTLVLFALAVGGAFWVAREIAQPVLSLKALAARMRAGQVSEDRPSGIIEIDQVATALNAASAELRGAREDLERQVEEAVARTRSAEQRLSQNHRVEALGRLTGGVAHDFNNLLGIISNSAHLMQRKDTTQSLQAPLSATLRAVEVGSRLTQNLMRFAGQQRVRAEPLALAPYLNEAKDLLRIVLGSRVPLVVSCEPALPPVTVDAAELELVLINLALNARDAMPDGGEAHLHARLAEAAEITDLPPGRYVRLALSDTGSGMEPGALTHVFEPFFTTKAAGKGTGLGLSQVHGFCQQAGGQVQIASRPGAGTTVALLLPVSGPAASPAPKLEQPDRLTIDGQRLLLVEDNADLAATTRQLLVAYGFQVTRVASAAQALQRVDGGEVFDLVLSDVVMPGELDGLMLARRLRARQPGLPIVLISGYSKALTEAHDFHVLHKPCAPSDLIMALKQALGGAGVQA